MKRLLTQEEIITAWHGVNFADMNAVTYARAIEAKILERICANGAAAVLGPDYDGTVTPLYAIPFIEGGEGDE